MRVNHNMSRSPSQLDCWGHPYPKQGQNQKIMSLPKSIKKSDHVLPLPSPPKKNENSKAEVCAPKRSREERGSLEDPSDPSLPFSFQRRGKSANPPRVSRLHCDRTKPKRLGGGGGGGLGSSHFHTVFSWPKNTTENLIKISILDHPQDGKVG